MAKKLRGLGKLDEASFFGWMDGFCENFDDLNDGAWQAACESAVDRFNLDHGTKIDPYDGWIAWVENNADEPSDMARHE